jgi:hypothetical protein
MKSNKNRDNSIFLSFSSILLNGGLIFKNLIITFRLLNIIKNVFVLKGITGEKK